MTPRLRENAECFRRARFTGPLLRFQDLQAEDIGFLTKRFLDMVPLLSEEGFGPVAGLHAELLHNWGVMCPHPSDYRLYNGMSQAATRPSFSEASWFSCSICNTRVINFDP